MSLPTAAPASGPTPPEDTTPSVYRLPFPPGFTERGGCPFDPPPMLRDHHDQGEVREVALTDGSTGWLVTGYEEGRTLLSDPRLSSDRLRNPLVVKLPAQLRAQLMADEAVAGNFIAMDPPDHTRYRRMLTRQFTLRRVRQLEPRILEIVTERIDAMLARGTGADLVRDFSLAVPSLVICELLGVAYEERGEFQARTEELLNLDIPFEKQLAALDELRKFILGQVRRKRATPTDDMLSDLIRSDTEPALTDEEVVGMANLLLVGGHETTANMLSLGTFALLEHPEQFRALRDRPELMDGAVEELLRYLSIVHHGLLRTTTEDVEIAGRTIPAESLVIISVSEANRDPRHYDTPAALDVSRPRRTHLAFGHGIHQCIGQQLARSEMTIAFPELLRRLPGLRLAVPADQVPLREKMAVYGLHSLPVTWDAPDA
ncbi:cytochrome P450 [Streptomyces spectabilis]|uniref:Cytochrome P450 n=2 Tax=Streptomyces spectabilis TaxID=68270 RepID=A0A7W8EW45_STRST|nr:cytochrome P450 [Streptomyces spectabilis]MBB5105280.1 cytochrome P450 [Streptomyces spectabilis]MCI3906474.1 cytochrome P450 [Streptomyces spectabilis]GGV51680.1 cytochrome P450 [Streptomyces spectabilis]